MRDLPELAAMFDSYRQFYNQPTDLPLATAFLAERLSLRDSAIFIARDDDGNGVGFAQLYPSLSSISVGRVFVLNDLFVTLGARRIGIGGALLAAAKVFAQIEQAVGLSLSTAESNKTAQSLYDRAGWTREVRFLTYVCPLV